MTTKELIVALIERNWTVQGLQSGKVRFTSPDGQTYLLSPVDAVQFGTWLNEKTILDEPLPKLQ